jgi:primosomal protein N' (replication factor Y)
MPDCTQQDPVPASTRLPLAQVAFALPLRQTFVYRIPDALADRVIPGVQVQAGFRGRMRRGFVVALERQSPREEIRDLAAVLDATPLSAHLLALCCWIADYYLAPLGEVLSAALPGGFEGFARSRARRSAVEDRVVPLALPERLSLTAEQRAATASIESAIAGRSFAPILLHGVTGSGKTEIYLRAARAARERGRQTLVLVPEVALSAQVLASFRRRFGPRVVALHSYLTLGERRKNWELARRGAADVVVGARSAVFAPLPALGLIVVDEEHEPAYKQSEQLRYHGRDTAVRRAQMLGIPIVLGSATPSLETQANAARGRYVRLELAHRVDRRPMPAVRIVDLRREPATASLMSQPLIESLRQRLARREQAVLFLNRRGHYHHTQCRACGFVPECPNCDISLTLHAAPLAWRCHYCDHHQPFGPRCPRCAAQLMRYSGAGTQRAERELAGVLPGARVLRLDTDVARARSSPASLLERFAAGDADVLIGTQMVAKGLDFPRVTLVGVLDADVALHLPDFRAAERTFQLLVQVSGRAGRGVRPGEVLIQTATPDHPAIAAAAARDERGFLAHELDQRREAGYPPFTRLGALFFSGRDEAKVERAAELASALVRADPASESVTVLGPAPQAIARLRGLHRWHVLLKSERAKEMRAAAARVLERLEVEAEARGVRVTPDIDPVA